MKPDFLTKSFLEIVIIILLIPVIMCYLTIGLHVAFGQTATTTQGLQPLPQDYYIVTSPPHGIQVQQSSSPLGIDLGEIISGLTGGGLAGLYAKFRADNNKKTTQEIAQTQVKIAEVQEGTLEQVYENMPQKGNEITNKPVIKQENVKEIKDKAVETASKA